jgi:sulfhydrogenase subunit beta (sulfur reductase)
MADMKNLEGLAKAVKDGGASFFVSAVRDGIPAIAEHLPGETVMPAFGNTKAPLKTFMFPGCETLYSYDNGGTVEISPSGPPSVVFGVRPCDAHSLLCLDRVFLDGKFTDPYYKRRRDNATIISVACSDPRSTCFCTSVDGGPSDNKGSDVLALEIEGGLLFRSCTAKGERLMEGLSGLLCEPDEAILRAGEGRISGLEKKVPRLDLTDLGEKLDARFHSALWREISETCLGCGVCTYLCPTCHCFALHDEGFLGKGKRIRVHDSCMYPSFIAEASGHNPRKGKADRMRQRIMHKFRYAVENYGHTFCVGCGRCISDCPANVDVRETIAGVRACG